MRGQIVAAVAVLAAWWALTNEDLPDRLRAWVNGHPYRPAPVTVCRRCSRPFRFPDTTCPSCEYDGTNPEGPPL